MLEIEDDRGKIHTEKLIRERLGHVHNQLDSCSKGGWGLPTDLRAQLRYDPFIANNLCEGDTNRKYEFKRVRQTKLIPTSECYGLEVLESVNTSVSRTSRDDVLPEDLWPNFNAMVTKLQERYIGSHEEMLVAQQHGFDRDFLACSSNAPWRCCTVYTSNHGRRCLTQTSVRRLLSQPVCRSCHARRFRKTHVPAARPRSNMISTKTRMPGQHQSKESNGQVCLCFAWRLLWNQRWCAQAKGRVTGTGYSKPDEQLYWPRDVTRCHQPEQSSWSWDESNSQQNWSWDKTKSRQEARSWDTVKTESKQGSARSGTARGRRDSGDEDEPRTSKNSPRQIHAEALVQPTALPEGWTVFLNASRQVLYGQVKTGMLCCFQIPERPEVLNNFVFKGAPPNGGDAVGRKRNDRCQPEPHKSKSKRHDHHQRSSQYMENITNHPCHHQRNYRYRMLLN